MSRKKYIVNLSEEERIELEAFVSKGTHGGVQIRIER